MAHVLAFSVSGLAGRPVPYSEEMHRDVNVFYGTNGSGKTSLLRILHSALVGDIGLVRRVQFERAEVTVFSNDLGEQVRYQAVKEGVYVLQARDPSSQTTLLPDAMGDSDAGDSDVDDEMIDRTPASWVVEPKPQHRSGWRWAHRYLPISRIAEDDRFQKSARYRSSESRSSPEESSEEYFARSIRNAWVRYSGMVSQQISDAQAEGLANVMNVALSGETPRRGNAKQRDLQPGLAFDRVDRFMRRQDPKWVPGDQATFERRYREEPTFQRTVDEINATEERIARISEPRDKLQELIDGMVGGPKAIRLSGHDISVESDAGEPIALADLSSGEKQMLRILIETLRADGTTIIIDEPEISMHVDWQERLVPAMRALSPDAQIIIATHSPDIMAEVEESKIFEL